MHNADEEKLADKIIEIKNMNTEKYLDICNNSLIASKRYDYKRLANDYLEILSELSLNIIK